MGKYLFQKKRAVFGVAPPPPDVPGFSLELDPDVFSSLTLAGSAILQIDDLSGFNCYFEGGNPPDYNATELNGRATIVFKGTDSAVDVLYGNPVNFVYSSSETWFFVIRADQTGQQDATLYSHYGGTPPSEKMLIRANNLASNKMVYVSDASANELTADRTLSSNFSLLVVTREPGKVTIDLNNSYTETTGTYLATTYSGIDTLPVLGAEADSYASPTFGTFFKGSIGYVRRYATVLSPVEIARVKAVIRYNKGI